MKESTFKWHKNDLSIPVDVSLCKRCLYRGIGNNDETLCGYFFKTGQIKKDCSDYDGSANCKYFVASKTALKKMQTSIVISERRKHKDD